MRRMLTLGSASLLLATVLIGSAAGVASAAPVAAMGFPCSPNGTLAGSPTTTDSRVVIDPSNPGGSALMCRFTQQLPWSIGGPCRYEDASVRADFRFRVLQPQRSGSMLSCLSPVILQKTDLAITKTDGVDKVQQGDATTYTIVVSNAGPNAVTGAQVSDTFPAAITAASYTSVATGGATGNTAAGSGNINDTVNLPVGSTITYTVTATTDRTYTGPLANTATVALPAGYLDTDPSNDSATDTDTVVVPPQLTTQILYGGDGGPQVFDSVDYTALAVTITCAAVPEDGGVHCPVTYHLNTVVTVTMTDDAQFLYICPDDDFMYQSTSSAPFTGTCTVTMDADKQVFIVGNEQL